MGNVAKWKTIGKFIIKSDFLILLIRAREGVFLLISCCGGRGGVASPSPPPHSHTNTNSLSYHIELLTHFQRPQNVILLLYYTMFTWIKISRAWQIDMWFKVHNIFKFLNLWQKCVNAILEEVPEAITIVWCGTSNWETSIFQCFNINDSVTQP